MNKQTNLTVILSNSDRLTEMSWVVSSGDSVFYFNKIGKSKFKEHEFW